MNRKVLQFLQQTGHACGYKDVLTGVDAHHQTIQNSLRDLERRGYAVKLGPNQWIASEIQIRKGELTVVE